MRHVPRHAPTIVLTGATGFVGHYLLAELLRRGCRCTTVLRGPIEQSCARVKALLGRIGVDADRHTANESLFMAKGNLHACLPQVEVDGSTVLVHVAAATNFEQNVSGDPRKTNVIGTQRLMAWATAWGIRRVHLVSSAYSCGKVTNPVREAFDPNPPECHNEYEHTKWESERIGVEWASAADRQLTIYRPSIVVGAFESGRATKFGGFYLSARSTELLDRMHGDRPRHERQAISLRICGRPLECQNIVPVDYVARIMAAVVCDSGRHGCVYNLVHPDPPSNLRIKQAFERYFAIGGGRFVAPESFESLRLSEQEQSFYGVSRSIQHYFVDTPRFLRHNVTEVERASGISCPQYDTDAIARLIRYAQSMAWGRRHVATTSNGCACAEYFEAFLPARVPKSQVARMTALNATVRFVIDDVPNGQWVCRFREGKLAGVERGANGTQEDFGYRTTRDVFDESISGQHHPQHFFLTGRAEMFGDIEKALKMAMVLHAFTQEFPCELQMLTRFGEGSCSTS